MNSMNNSMNKEKQLRVSVDPNGVLIAPDKSKFGKFSEDLENIYLKKVHMGRRDPKTGIVYDVNGSEVGLLANIPTRAIPSKALSKTPKSSVSKSSVEKKKIETSSMSEKVLATVPLNRRRIADDVYKPGKDSKLIVTGQLSKQLYGNDRKVVTAADIALEEANKKNGWKYLSWEDLCEKEDLSEKFLITYDQYIDWYGFLLAHPKRTFTAKFEKKYWKRLLMRTLGIA